MNTKHRLITILSSIALCASCAIGVSSAGAQTSAAARVYSLTDLGVLPDQQDSIPAAINNQGQVAGTSGDRAFRYTTSGKPMEDVGRQTPNGTISRGFGINQSGLVVGDSHFGKNFSHAAVFSNGSVADLGTLRSGGSFSRANGINANGQVIGFSSETLDGASSRAFIVSIAGYSGAMIDLGTLGGAYAQAWGINDSGVVTGNSQIKSDLGATHAFIWEWNAGMVDLGTLGGDFSYGTSINAKNHVAGYSMIDKDNSRVHAFLYVGEKMHDQMLDLGSLSGTSLDLDFSYALGVNSADQVVGYSYLPWEKGYLETPFGPWPVAFIYSEGVMLDLNDLIGDAAKNYRLDCATAINDNGQIAAIAFNQFAGAFHAVLLTPLSR